MFALSALIPISHSRIRAGLALAASLCCIGATAPQSAEMALVAMQSATRNLNYDGVFVYHRADQLESMRLIHRYADDTETERMISLSGPAREVIRVGSLVTCWSLDAPGGALDKNPPRDIIGIGFSAPVEKLRGSYTFAIDGTDRVAGRNALVVTVNPRSPDRYAYRLWLDEQTHLLLKSAILDVNGHSLEQVQFTQLEVSTEIPSELLKPGINGTAFQWRTDAETDGTTAPEMPDWLPDWLPTGFEIKESGVEQPHEYSGATSHLIYSDGLSMVSIFVETVTDDKQALQGESSRGAVNAYSRLNGKHQITAVGEIPLSTLKKIAESVSKSNK